MDEASGALARDHIVVDGMGEAATNLTDVGGASEASRDLVRNHDVVDGTSERSTGGGNDHNVINGTNDTAANLGTLNSELLAIILDYVVSGSRSPFPTIYLINHHIKNVARALVKRTIHLDFDGPNITSITKKIENIIGDDLLLPNIRVIKVSGCPGNYCFKVSGKRIIREENTDDAGSISSHSDDDEEEEGEENEEDGDTEDEDTEEEEDQAAMNGDVHYNFVWEPLGRLLSRVPNLQEIQWSAQEPIPRIIIEIIEENHPMALLNVWKWNRRAADEDGNNEDEMALARCPNLRKIQASLWISEQVGGPFDYREPAIWRIIATAPNLTHASITKVILSRPWVPNDHNEEPYRSLLATFAVNSRSPSVSSITVDGYTSDVLQKVDQFVDLSQLRSFKYSRYVPDVSFFQTAMSKMTNLKHLALNFGDNDHMPSNRVPVEETERFVDACNGLESISFWSWRKVISLNTILKHGPTLRNLQLREREPLRITTTTSSPTVHREVMTCAEIEEIRLRCHKLDDLTIDLRFNDFDTTNIRICQELSKFNPPLTSLQIYFESDSDKDGPNTPLRRMRHANSSPTPQNSFTVSETLKFLHDMWSSIFPHPSPSTTKLTIKFGEWERKVSISSAAAAVKKYFVIHQAERDDRKHDICVEMFRMGVFDEPPSVREILCQSYPTEFLQDSSFPRGGLHAHLMRALHPTSSSSSS